MKFLVDVQLPRPLVNVIRRGGHDADYATDHLPAIADDRENWALAATFGAAIVTEDGDFADLAARRRERVAVIWLRCGNMYNPDLYALIAYHWSAIVAAIERGDRVIESR